MNSTGSATSADARAPVPSALFLSDHFGYPSEVVHGLTSRNAAVVAERSGLERHIEAPLSCHRAIGADMAARKA